MTWVGWWWLGEGGLESSSGMPAQGEIELKLVSEDGPCPHACATVDNTVSSPNPVLRRLIFCSLHLCNHACVLLAREMVADCIPPCMVDTTSSRPMRSSSLREWEGRENKEWSDGFFAIPCLTSCLCMEEGLMQKKVELFIGSHPLLVLLSVERLMILSTWIVDNLACLTNHASDRGKRRETN